MDNKVVLDQLAGIRKVSLDDLLNSIVVVHLEMEKDWKLKLRYGKLETPYSHFTVLADGIVEELAEGFKCPKGKAWMAMKTWASSTGESADIIKVIGQQIGFTVTGKTEVYETEPTQPPSENPYGYDINFTPYDEE